MTFSPSMRGLFQTFAVVLSVVVPLVLAVPAADARIGGGGSSGSRGARTFSAPPPTTTAPSAARPFDRTMTTPTTPGIGAPAVGAGRGGFFNRPGLLGGLAAGFLGAGLFGMLFGGSMFGGLGGLSSIIGLVLQIGLVLIVVRLAMAWWQRRNATAYASGPARQCHSQTRSRGSALVLVRMRHR
jgi:predicted lipid-binding transport protein (Tim44 family)